MAETRDFMTVGELAESVGKTPRAIRLYEELGLLAPRGRTCGNYREYGPEALVRLRWITHLHDLGLPLNEVKGFLDDVAEAENAGVAMARVRARYAQTLACVDAQIARLQQLRDGLTASIEWLSDCQGCEGPVPVIREACQTCDRHEGQIEPDLVRGVKAQPPSQPAAPCGGKQESK